MKWTLRTLIALNAGLLVLCLYLAYHALDQAVSLDHAWSRQDMIEKELDVLRSFTLDMTKGAKRDAIRNLLTTKYARDHLIKDEDKDTIHVDNVGLRFRGDELVGIILTSEAGAQNAR
jgi:hypothetical protein